jgi:hypothetical protein
LSEKLILCCRLPGAGMPSRGRGYLERARSIIVRAEARGGTLIAWGNARLYFALDPTAIEDAIALATKPGEEGRPGEERFAFGIAQGSIESLESDGSRGELAWGHALVAAGALAMAARPGQVMLADRVKAVRAGELVMRGGRFAEEAGMRLRGLALDVQQPWKRDAIATISRLVEPPLVAAEADAALAVKPGTYGVLVAARGYGGTRRLESLSARFGDRALVIKPVGGALEPLGALRRAVARVVSRDLPSALAAHASALESLLSSEPLAIDVAQDLVAAYLAPRASGSLPGAVLVDDADLVDLETLEVVAAAMRGPVPLPVVLRVAPDAQPIAAFAKAGPAAMVTLDKLSDQAAEALASAFAGGVLDDDAKTRWAKLGQGSPLGILEALTHGLQSTELAFIGDRAFPRRKVSGRGKPRPAAHFVTLRAHECAPAARTFLATIALLGGEARLDHVAKIVAAAEQPVQVEAMAAELGRSRWVVFPEPGWVAFPSRTHLESLVQILEPPLVQALRRAAVDVLDSGENGFAKLEAVAHAMAVGDAERARKIVSTALLGLRQAKLTAAVARLRTLVDLPVKETSETTDEHTMPGAVSARTPASADAKSFKPEPVPDELPPESEPTFVLMKANPPAPGTSLPVSDRPAAVVPTHSTPTPTAQKAAQGVPAVGPGAVPSVGASGASGTVGSQASSPPSSVAPASKSLAPQGAPAAAKVQTPNGAPAPNPKPMAVPAAVASPPPPVQHASVAPQDEGAPDSEPPTIADAAPVLTNLSQLQRTLGPNTPSASSQIPPTPALPQAPPPAAPKTLADRMKDAIMSSNHDELERLLASGESGNGDGFAERVRALSRLKRGEIGDALRVLRRVRHSPDAGPSARCQTALALGIAYAASSRFEESLLEGLTALARAREAGDPRGVHASLAFLARLYHAMSRTEEATQLREAAAEITIAT